MSARVNYLDQVKLMVGDAGTDVTAWVHTHLADVKSALVESGAVLLRGFRSEALTTAEDVLHLLYDEILDDAFWSTPRFGVAGKTFTATEYPAPRTIALHSEMAYMKQWPRLVAFHALIVADQGGETTIGNLDDISRDLGEETLRSFARGVTYQRSYHDGVDIPWQTAFRTQDRSAVAKIAKRAGMSCTWSEDGSLYTSHDAQGCVTAEDGRMLWFNQAHVFHASNLSEKDRSTLTSLFGDDGLPRNARFANGQTIDDATIKKVHDALEANSADVKWQPGDVLVLDNMRYMHGRRPFSGSRKLHVALAQSQSQPARTPLFAQRARPSFWQQLVGRRA